MALETPVALIIFKRPETTKKVFDAIAEAQPKRLFVIADGPRSPEEAGRCQQARAVVEKVDWDCEVLRNYSEINLGCKRRVSSGLDWVFSQVEEAIILEDDCVPAPSFFNFCQALLERYRNDERIMMITGSNVQDGQERTEYSYYFSKRYFIWGWATWSRAWRYYDVSLKTWPDYKKWGLLRFISDTPYQLKGWMESIESVFSGALDTWDFQWAYACAFQSGLCIVPNSNLISNIGFGRDATHTGGKSPLAELPTADIWEIKHPPFVLSHRDADAYTSEYVLGDAERRKADLLSGRIRLTLSAIKRRLRSWLRLSR